MVGQSLSYISHDIVRIHSNLRDQGKASFEISRGHEVHTLFISKAEPGELKSFLLCVEDATQHQKRHGKLQQADAISLMQRRFPEQMKKQMRALREMADIDVPQPLKGHTRLMIMLDAQQMSAAQAGKKLGNICEGLGLSTTVRSSSNNSQAWAAVGKDAAKANKLSINVHSCSHHKFKCALWLDLDVGEGIDIDRLLGRIGEELAGCEMGRRCSITRLPHGGVKEKLGGGLIVHLRSGRVRTENGEAFTTRLELRAEGAEGGEVLGKCDVRYWEEGLQMAGPVCMLFSMHKEACTAWCMQYGHSPAALASTLVFRMEVFCLRLVNSSTGFATRPKLLVAGWLQQVSTSAFIKRGFQFQASEQSLGFKMLTSPTATKSSGKRKRSPEEPTVSSISRLEPELSARTELTVDADSPERESNRGEYSRGESGQSESTAIGAVLEGVVMSGTPAMDATASRLLADDRLKGVTPRTSRHASGESKATQAAAFDKDVDIIELGELSCMGRIIQSGGEQSDPSMLSGFARHDEAEEDDDEVDATLRELGVA
eukprot:CAMPEP_0119318400 /NCGR_PEP_ID=MMETSP1333-20130426/46260_1 /TAXON_ID=418940 /ORGANISM="Scyphosphaera apsteinii, Strain RCC1455" /LENGTH=543 /DNA_ID=CAMNT_0007324561 /DNA_START=161 /DNA_END=1792 /DNA_ORIENTATION=-